MKDNKIDSHERLTHILEAINNIEVFIRNMRKESFLKDQLVASAVLFQFSVIGEAIIHVDADILKNYDYSWHKVRAFRNLISHMYFQIKLDAVWNIIVNDLPELTRIVKTIINEEF